MRSAGSLREILNEHINLVMRSAFEGGKPFEQAKEKYDYYYYLFQSTWDYRGKAYKYFLAKEINNATEDWKQAFLKDLYRFYCPEEFKEIIVRDEELSDMGEIRPALEETITLASDFSQDFREVPAPSWIGDLHPVEEAPIRIRIGE